MSKIPKRKLTTYIRFFGNLCSIDNKIEEITYFQDAIEELIDNENVSLSLIHVEYDQDPKLFDRKLYFGKVFNPT